MEENIEDTLKFNFTPTTTSDEELSSIGRRQAAGVAADKGTVAGKQARAAARQAGGSRLFAAIQGAQAANDASAQGFSEEANTARAMKMQKDQAANELSFNKASQEYQGELQKRAAAAQREHEEKMAEAQRKHDEAMEAKRMEFEKSEREKDREETRADRAAQKEQSIAQLTLGMLSSLF